MTECHEHFIQWLWAEFTFPPYKLTKFPVNQNAILNKQLSYQTVAG